MTPYQQYQLEVEQRKRDQLAADHAQGIVEGDIVKIDTGNKGRDGFGTVTAVIETDGVLHIKSKRLIDFYGRIVVKGKPGQPIPVSRVVKYDVEAIEKMRDKSIQYAIDVRDHLIANRRR